ncbi:MAG: riboflavin kinase [Patescibacteria group bacterium]
MIFSITAKIIKGQGIGYTIGFPTANLDKIPSEKKLKPGVYAGQCWIGERSPLGKEETPDDNQAEVFLNADKTPHPAKAGHPSLKEGNITNENYSCLAYFGPRYIFGETKNAFEIHILNFDKNIVGQELTVELEHFIRSPKKIKNLEELKKQLKKDKKTTLELLK